MRGPYQGPGVSAASGLDRLQLLIRVVLPTWAKGILRPRPRGMGIAARFELDRGAVRFLQQLRRKYGDRPLALRSPAGPQFLLLSADDVMQALAATPEPFSPATAAKRAALSHFEPHVSLITRGAKRRPRRQFSDDVLESRTPVHSLAGNFLAVVRDEADRLVNALRGSNGPTRNNLTIGEPTSNDLTNYDLTWPIFSECWHAAVRRIVLGDAARADRALTGQLAKLRDTANWVLFPKRKSVKADYDQRLNTYLARAQAGSLADVISRRAQEGDEHPLDQITHWLFAFDAGAMTTFRTLALLASHAVPRAKAGSDIQSWQNGRADLPYLRACFLDAVRLWPTAPVILREATGTTSLGSAVIAKGAGIIVYVPFFNRDGERLANADRFDPDFWLGRDPAEAYPFVPFSAGPGACPGRHMVALIGAAWLAALLHAGRWTSMTPPQLDPLRPLPGTLDHYAIRLRLSAR